MVDVCLISMPFAAIENPSLALGILKASLDKTKLEAICLYPGFELAEQIGPEVYQAIAASRPEMHAGDWVFSGAAFPGHDAARSQFLDRQRSGLDASTLERVAEQASAFVARVAKKVVDTGARIVGCTSVFQQHVASLALLRAVKELDPNVVTMIGGGNCEAEMGVTTLQQFEWVDFVVSGESDLLFAELCETIIQHGPAAASRLGLVGVLGPEQRQKKSLLVLAEPADVPRAVVDDLDQVPMPDFDDYFEELSRSPINKAITPGLLMETSRGCWWGQIKHCTFCGFNGESMPFRAKSSSRVLEELATLSQRYGVDRIQMVDNILSRDHLKTVIVELAAARAPYKLFYHTKANLSRDEISVLSDAGVRFIQPGLEGMHRGALDLLAKGTSPVVNVQSLKWAREHGVRMMWNMLTGLPGEELEWYRETAAWLPLISHLQPPAGGMARVRFDRFSPYYLRSEEHGLELRPYPAIGLVYPSVPETALSDLAYFFFDRSHAASTLRKADTAEVQALRHALGSWIDLWRTERHGKELPALERRRVGDAVLVTDTRPIATAREHTLEGLDAVVLDLCDEAPSFSGLLRRLKQGQPDVEPTAVRASLSALTAAKLVLELDERLVGLPVRPGRDIPARSEFPGGVFQEWKLAPTAAEVPWELSATSA